MDRWQWCIDGGSGDGGRLYVIVTVIGGRDGGSGKW